MTKEEFNQVRKDALDRIDAAIREGMRVMDETQRLLEDLSLERKVTESNFEEIKKYLIG